MLSEDRVSTSVPSSVYTRIDNPDDTRSEVNIYIYRLYFVLYVNIILYSRISYIL